MRFLAVLTPFLFTVSFAAPLKKENLKVKIDTVKIEQLVNEFFIAKNAEQAKLQPNQYFSFNPGDRRPGDCRNPRNNLNCLDVACQKMGQYRCDDQSEIDAVLVACRGVDGSCVESVCNKMGQYRCDDMSEIQSVANVCRNVFDSRCMDVVCSKMGQYRCDDMSEIQSVAGLCSGRVDSDCIESVCARLGQYKCDDFSEIQAVARSCGGK